MLREVVLETGTGTWRGDNNDGSVSGSMRVSQKSDIDPSLVSVCCCAFAVNSGCDTLNGEAWICYFLPLMHESVLKN